jgi:hypothetical protein
MVEEPSVAITMGVVAAVADDGFVTTCATAGPTCPGCGDGFRKEPLGFLERLAAYGDVVRIDVPGSAAYLLNHPDLVHEVLSPIPFVPQGTTTAAKLLPVCSRRDDVHRRQRRRS